VRDYLRSVGLDVLDVVNFRSMFDAHGPAEGSLEAPLTALAELREHGLVRHIGLSNVTMKQVEEAKRIGPVACVQNMCKLAHRNDDAMIDVLSPKAFLMCRCSRWAVSCRCGRVPCPRSPGGWQVGAAGGDRLAVAAFAEHPADSGETSAA
jgi:hypothetical protein